MKSLALIAFVCFAAIGADAPSPGQVGRYQLTMGNLTIHPLGRPTYTEACLFRIDTATGTVWRYVLCPTVMTSNVTAATSFDGWTRTEENILDSFRKAGQGGG